MRDINVVAEKMARNGLKIANSLGCAFHFESEFTIVCTYLQSNTYMPLINLFILKQNYGKSYM